MTRSRMDSPPSPSAQDRARAGVDGDARYSAIPRQHCQHIDEALAALAQAGPDHLAPPLDRLEGDAQPHRLAAGDGGALLLLVETAGILRFRRISGEHGESERGG